MSAGSKQELRYQARICLKSSQVNCPLISMQQGQSAHMPKKICPMGYFRIMRHHRACSSSITSHPASVIHGMHQDASANGHKLRHWESKTIFWGFYSLYAGLQNLQKNNHYSFSGQRTSCQLFYSLFGLDGLFGSSTSRGHLKKVKKKKMQLRHI